MAGRAPFTKEEAAPLERCALLNGKNQWEPASNPLNKHSTIRKNIGMQKMGPGYSFAKAMLASDDGIEIGLVVNAKGGSRISQWFKGTAFYNDAVGRTKAAIALGGGSLKGILWHQGESDAKNPKYLEELTQLISDLRADLGDPELPFVAGQVKDLPSINDRIAALPAAVPHTAYASSKGLKTTDRWHFDAPGVRLLGERYAEAMLKLLRR